MGQTLTHGVYLPDEGERNCYSGLAGNWTILDNSVGTIAAHTAALSGKAPLVHTHTVSQITDFPAYGNAAGTICEGNDSRLSDARTPVAHTHGKADITDLFNSANTWSDSQTFLTNPIIRNDTIEKGVSPAANSEKTVTFTDKNNNQISSLYARMNVNGESYVALRAENLYKNGAMDSTGDLVYSVLFIGMDSQGNPYCVPRADLYPDNTNRFNLGTSSKKWKTLNGVNPGALSLPESIINLDSTNWDLTGVTFTYTPSADGWLSINIQPDNNYAYVALETGRMRSNSENTTGKNAMAFIAVRANIQVSITLFGASVAQARLVTCAGNV